MLRTKFALKMLVIVAVLAVTALAGSSPASNEQPGTAPDPVINTVLQPDLTLHSTFSLPVLPEAMELGVVRHGSCRCGCGGTCTTNADCGPGGVCEPFISCCDRTGQVEWIEGVGLSSHRGEMPALNVKCK